MDLENIVKCFSGDFVEAGEFGRVVKKFESELEIESEEGTGTTVLLTMPAAELQPDWEILI